MNQTNQTTKPHDVIRAENRNAVLLALAEAFKRMPEADKDTAPTTHAFCTELDKPNQFGQSPKFPMQVFADWHPESGPWYRPGRLPKHNPSTMKALLGEHLKRGKTILPEKDIQTLKEAQAKLDDIDLQAAKWSNVAAFSEFQSQPHKLIDATLSAGKVPASQLRSLDAIRAEHSAKSAALAELAVKIGAEVFPVTVKAVFAAFEIARAKMRDLEEFEREQAASYGLDWNPSWLWRQAAVIQIISNPNRLKISANSRTDPRHLLAGIIDL